jgi:hypothetical protein
MFGIPNVGNIENYLHDCDGLCDTSLLSLVRPMAGQYLPQNAEIYLLLRCVKKANFPDI